MVIEAWRTSSMAIELAHRVQYTRVFLRMAAIELRRIAEGVPHIATELHHIAQQLDTEVKDLAHCDTDNGAAAD